MHSVGGRILPDEHAVGYVHVCLDVLHDISATRAENILVGKCSLYIAETTDRVKIVLLVVVQRCLFA